MSIALGQDTGVIAPESLNVAVIDTTVMPKAVAYPSDARLADRCHRQLVELAKDEGIKFRQTFCKGLTGLVWQVGRYAHARQFKRMHKVLRQMHRNLARICEAIVDQRTMEQRSERLNHTPLLWVRILKFIKDDNGIHGGDKPPQCLASMQQIANIRREEVEAHAALVSGQTVFFSRLRRSLCLFLRVAQFVVGSVAVANVGKGDRFGGRRKDREVPRKTCEVTVRLEDAPKEGMVGLNVYPAFDFLGDFLLKFDSFYDPRYCRSGKAQKQHLLSWPEDSLGNLSGLEYGNGCLAGPRPSGNKEGAVNI